MKKLILAILLFLVGCNEVINTTGSGSGPQVVEGSDTLFIVSSYPAVYFQAKGGDSIGSQVHTIQQKHLDETNGITLNKITERVEGEGWSIKILPKSEDYENKEDSIEILIAPINEAYYYDLEMCEWITVPLSAVIDSMEYKGVWE